MNAAELVFVVLASIFLRIAALYVRERRRGNWLPAAVSGLLAAFCLFLAFCSQAHAALIASAVDGQTLYGLEQPRFDLYDERGSCPEGQRRVTYVRPRQPPMLGCWHVADDLIAMTFPKDVTTHVPRGNFRHVYRRLS